MILYVGANIDNKYISVIQNYCSTQSSVFSHILLMLEKKCSVLKQFHNAFTMCGHGCVILFAVIRKKWNTAWRDIWFDANNGMGWCEVLKRFKKITSTDTDLLPPYYYDCIWWKKWILPALHSHNGIEHHVNFPVF